MKLNINQKEDGDNLGAFLSGIEIESVEIEKQMLKKSGEKAKELAVAELNKHRRVVEKRYKGRPAMADDVKVNIRTNKWGEKYVRVGGSKKTGTLWHLVNDGNLHSTPTHFMDNALNRLDGSIDEIWDETMK